MTSDPLPTIETLRVLLMNQGLVIEQSRLEQVVETHQAFRPALEQIREVELSYTDAIEPAHVLQWVESGGRSATSPEGGADGE